MQFFRSIQKEGMFILFHCVLFMSTCGSMSLDLNQLDIL